MKITRLVVAVVLILGMFVAFTRDVSAQGKYSYTSGIQIQNLSSENADIRIQYYRGGTGPDAGQLVTETTRTATPNEVFFYFPIPISGQFQGSVTVLSTKAVAAISNLLSSNYAAQASYVGSSQGNTTIILPLLDKGNSGWDSWFSVQNTSDTVASVSVDYGDCTTDPGAVNVQPFSSVTFYQVNESCHTKKIFPAVITSNKPVVATAIRETTQVLTAYTGFSGGSTEIVIPLVNVQPPRAIQTGINIQNFGSVSSDITLSYDPSQSGTACTEKQTIPAGEMRTFALAAFANSSNPNENCINGSTFIGSARVSANTGGVPLTGVVTQFTPTIGAMYSAFNPNNGSSKVVFPTIFDRRGSQKLWTSVAIMNVGTATIQVNCTFTNTSYSISQQLEAGKGFNYLQNGNIADNYFGAGTCVATKINPGDPDPKIVGQSNEVGGPGVPGDVFLIYEGINQ
jgi:hypothetical protein